jgi:hypothetical protein
MNPQLLTLARQLRDLTPRIPEQRVLTGFDGFVDEMITVVGERHDSENYTPVPDIGTFGKLVQAAAGHSSLREIVVNRTDAGGCAVNLGDGLAAFGLPLSCYATLGRPAHPAFAEFLAKCEHYESWGDEPGRTLAYEFQDGKLMFSAVQQLTRFTPESVRESVAAGNYMERCEQAALIALTNWTLYPHMTEVWSCLLEEVYGKLSHRPVFFFDLVDPGARTDSDVADMLKVLSRFEKCGTTVLGVNGNEGNRLARVLGLPQAGDDPESLCQQALALQGKLGISQVTIHLTQRAVAAEQGSVAAVEGPYCAKPRKSTGAGDRFNAGYCLGLVLGLNPTERLLTAVSSSGFFVREARSASPEELIGFIENWGQGNVGQ